ncbi:MAG: Nramp family divalent metal transporter [Candidatus Omnitrophica bacterium]|nr:Nramp family divalent metal transporter [Candidatus Omnitrophota bacterium]
MDRQERPPRRHFWRTIIIFLSVLGPGIITASAGNDAGGITTYSVAGAHYGYSILWVFIPMLLPLIVLQEMCARMGIVTGKGLADLIREKFGVKVTFYAMAMFLLSAFTNTLSEFSGIAASGEIAGIPRYASLIISAAVIWWIVVKGTYKSVEKIFLVGAFFYIAYIVSGFLVRPDWGTVGREMVSPRMELNKGYLIIVMGLLGTTIAPWMQFYQQSTIVEKGIRVKDYNYTKIDITIGGVVMIIVAVFIVIACAGTLFKSGIRIETAKDAALALKPLAGRHCALLFGFGLFNASFFSAMILPLAAAYSVCEGLGWETGVDKRFKDAPQFYFLFTFLIAAGAGIIMLPKVNLVKVMLFSQVANSIFLPFVLVFMMILINDGHLMGQYKNSRFFNIVSLVTIIAIILLTAGLAMVTLMPR